MDIKKTLNQLKKIPELAQEVAATRGTNPITTDGDKPHKIPGSIVLADLDRMMVFDGANEYDGLGVIASWVRAIADELEEAGTPLELPEGTVAACCAWLSERLDWCQGRGFENELAADIDRLYETLKRICRINDLPALPCRTPGCDSFLQPVAGGLECEHGHRHDGLRKWRFHAAMPLPELAEQLDVPERTLRRWVAQGNIPFLESAGKKPYFCWPWDVLRMKYRDLTALVEERGVA